MKSFIQYIFIASCLFILSCTKNAEDITSPVITVVEPVSSDTLSFSVEPEIHMEFTVTDETNLASLEVAIFDSSSNMVYSAMPSVSGLKVYPFHDHYEPTSIAAITPYAAKYTAIDKAGNTTIKQIYFVMKP